MVVGELVHAMESRVIEAGTAGGTADLLDELEGANDRLAALIEQRLARRHTPDFSVADRDSHGAPPRPKATPPSKPGL